ncbi:EpsG family protein [Prevotella melaninogenica]|nr:EpsG family protein [Prevotella melaninogenica]
MKRAQLPIFIFLGVMLILIAAFREIGIDPDSLNYAMLYQNPSNSNIADHIEYSFTLIATLLNNITDSPHAIFLVYAMMGVSLKMIAFKKYSNHYILMFAIYMCYFYELHELTQIRAGVASGFFLISVLYTAERKKRKAALCILLGAVFHISAIALLPTLLLGNKPLNKKVQFILYMSVPIGYLIYFTGMSVLFNLDIPLIGDKLSIYQEATEKGIAIVEMELFNPVYLLNVIIFYFLLIFHETITQKIKYSPLLLKVYATGLVIYPALGFLPVLSLRLSELYYIVNIYMIGSLYYTIKPRWAGLIIITIICISFYAFGLPHIGLKDLVKI